MPDHTSADERIAYEFKVDVTAPNYPVETHIADTDEAALARARNIVRRWNRMRTPGTRPIVATATLHRREISPWQATLGPFDIGTEPTTATTSR